MAKVEVDGAAVRIELSRFERVVGLLPSTEVPLDAIDSVELAPDPHAVVRGVRAPGLGIPRSTKIGTWRGRSGRTFVCVRGSRAAVVLTTVGREKKTFDRYVVSVDDPEAVVAAIDDAMSARDGW